MSDSNTFFAAVHENQTAKLTPFEKSVYEKHFPVEVKIKKSSYEKEFRTQISQQFKTISDVADLYKTENYADNIQNNYALSAEEHYYKVSYTFDGSHFKRIVKITDPVELKKQQDNIASLEQQLSKKTDAFEEFKKQVLSLILLIKLLNY